MTNPQGDPNDKAFAGKAALLVDDDPDYLASMELMLQGAGFAVTTAESIQQATDRLGDLDPDVAIVDLMLEESDAGFTLCHRIKKKNESIPVIMVSGVMSETGFDFDAATPEERAWIKADAFLAKPVRFEQLSRELTRLLKD
jgi:CheY-like chemotaxis protein